MRCPVTAAGQIVVDCCELCALRPRELEVVSSMGWLAGWHVHGPPSWTESRVCRFNNSAFAFDSSSSRHQHYPTATPHQAVLNHRHAWCPNIPVSILILHPVFLPRPDTLRDDILEFCNANGSSLPLSGGRYGTRCGLT